MSLERKDSTYQRLKKNNFIEDEAEEDNSLDEELEEQGVFMKERTSYKDKVKNKIPLTEEELNTLERSSRGGSRVRCAMKYKGCSRFVSKRGIDKGLCWYHFNRLDNADKREYESELAETEKELLRTQTLAEKDLEDLEAREQDVEELAQMLIDEELAKEIENVRKRITDKMAEIRAHQLKAKKSPVKFRDAFKESLKRHMDDQPRKQPTPKRQSPPREAAPEQPLIPRRKKVIPPEDPGLRPLIIPDNPRPPTMPEVPKDLIITPKSSVHTSSSSDYFSELEPIFSFSNFPTSGEEEFVDIDGMDTDLFIDSPNPKNGPKPLQPTKSLTNIIDI